MGESGYHRQTDGSFQLDINSDNTIAIHGFSRNDHFALQRCASTARRIAPDILSIHNNRYTAGIELSLEESGVGSTCASGVGVVDSEKIFWWNGPGGGGSTISTRDEWREGH